MKVAAIAVIALVIMSGLGAPGQASRTALAASTAPPIDATFDCDTGVEFTEAGCQAIRAAYEAAATTVAEIGRHVTTVSADPVWRTFRLSVQLQSRIWLRSAKARILGVFEE